MSKGKQKALGRGLSVLLPKSENERGSVAEIALDRIDPNPEQPRRTFSEDALKELADSIRVHGVVQPVIVKRSSGDRYSLIAGERRLRAAKLAGLGKIPCLVREYTEKTAAEIALIENLQREDLNPVEEGRAYRGLLKKYGYTQEELADIVGKSRPYVTNMLRIVTLPDVVLQPLSEGKITIGQVRPLLGLMEGVDQIELARRIEKENLSSRQVEDMVRRIKGKKPAASQRKEDKAAAYFGKIESDLKLSLGMRVTIKNGKGKNGQRGVISIAYNNEEEFQRVIAFLKKEE